MMSRIAKFITKFVIVMIPLTIMCTITWQLVGDRLYDCTDDNWLGFWRPFNWVHDVGNQHIKAVPHIVHGRSMSEPDTIKEGWGIGGVFCLWLFFVAGLLATSITLARMPWLRQR